MNNENKINVLETKKYHYPANRDLLSFWKWMKNRSLKDRAYRETTNAFSDWINGYYTEKDYTIRMDRYPSQKHFLVLKMLLVLWNLKNKDKKSIKSKTPFTFNIKELLEIYKEEKGIYNITLVKKHLLEWLDDLASFEQIETHKRDFEIISKTTTKLFIMKQNNNEITISFSEAFFNMFLETDLSYLGFFWLDGELENRVFDYLMKWVKQANKTDRKKHPFDFYLRGFQFDDILNYLDWTEKYSDSDDKGKIVIRQVITKTLSDLNKRFYGIPKYRLSKHHGFDKKNQKEFEYFMYEVKDYNYPIEIDKIEQIEQILSK